MPPLLRRLGIAASLSLLVAGLRAEIVVDDPGRFLIDMPAPQTRSQNETESGLGATTLHLLTHDADATTGFILGYNDYPAGSVAKLDLAETYHNVMVGVLNSMKSEVVTSGEHQLGDTKGWDYTFKAKDDQMAGHVRTYFVGDRLYQVMYLGAVGSENSDKALRFLDSFRLLR